MKLAIFPGTFNPIHIAHLIMAENAREQCNLDKVVFITANIPPHRDKDIAPAKHRHRMVELSCAENEFFEASDIELHRDGPSYTYDTLVEIKTSFPEITTPYVIIGTDAIAQLHTWNNAQDIVDMSHFLITYRPGYPPIEDCLQKTGLLNFNYKTINSPLLEISSTLIRANMSNRGSIKYLVLDSVREYIEKNGLYRE